MPLAGFEPMFSLSKRSRPMPQTAQPLGPAILVLLMMLFQLITAKDFLPSLCVQTSSEAHPASYSVGTGGPFPGGKVQPGHDTDH
jgi:hypothetical protein